MIPKILTENTYFWHPAGSAGGRRANEERHNTEVAQWLEANREALQAAGLVVEFDYSESCNHVYKTFKVWKDGKRSNITAVYKALGIERE